MSTFTFQPRRVVTQLEADHDGFRYVARAMPPDMARRDHGIEPDVLFVRDDGWSLGATWDSASPARRMWEGYWEDEVVLDDRYAWCIILPVDPRYWHAEHLYYVDDHHGVWDSMSPRYARKYRALSDALIALCILELTVDPYQLHGQTPFVGLVRVK